MLTIFFDSNSQYVEPTPGRFVCVESLRPAPPNRPASTSSSCSHQPNPAPSVVITTTAEAAGAAEAAKAKVAKVAAEEAEEAAESQGKNECKASVMLPRCEDEILESNESNNKSISESIHEGATSAKSTESIPSTSSSLGWDGDMGPHRGFQMYHRPG